MVSILEIADRKLAPSLAEIDHEFGRVGLIRRSYEFCAEAFGNESAIYTNNVIDVYLTQEQGEVNFELRYLVEESQSVLIADVFQAIGLVSGSDVRRLSIVACIRLFSDNYDKINALICNVPGRKLMLLINKIRVDEQIDRLYNIRGSWGRFIVSVRRLLRLRQIRVIQKQSKTLG